VCLLAAIYIACREIGKTLKEIAEGSNVKSKTHSQSNRILITELDIKIPMLDPMKCMAVLKPNCLAVASTEPTIMSLTTITPTILNPSKRNDFFSVRITVPCFSFLLSASF